MVDLEGLTVTVLVVETIEVVSVTVMVGRSALRLTMFRLSISAAAI